MIKKSLIFSIGILLCLSLGVTQSGAGELTYQPVNPNFGGNPFNAAPLLANANAQNNFKDPEVEARRTSRSSAESFQERLDRSILSRLSRDLVTQAFGEDAIGDGTFDTGVNTIDIVTGLDATVITITDNETGEVTSVEVPFF
jgi:curli production assembly/transport component CsgF